MTKKIIADVLVDGSSSAKLRPGRKEAIDHAIEVSTNQPWFVAYHEIDELNYTIWTETKPSTEAEVRDSQNTLANAVTSFLEGLGADPDNCSDPFQSVVYKSSTRKDFQKAAADYAKSVGGDEGVQHQLNEWVAQNSDRLEDLAFEPKVRMGSGEYDEPCDNLGEFLIHWTTVVKEEFDPVEPMPLRAVGNLADGRWIMFGQRKYLTNRDFDHFVSIVREQFEKYEVTMTLTVSTNSFVKCSLRDVPINPNEAEGRKEGFLLVAATADESMATIIEIERDWETGEPRLGETIQFCEPLSLDNVPLLPTA